MSGAKRDKKETDILIEEASVGLERDWVLVKCSRIHRMSLGQSLQIIVEGVPKQDFP